jgi:single-strand DNA-binding protein
MNNIRNEVRLTGHVGHAPEVKNLDGDKKVVSFSLAVKDNFKNRENEYGTTWFRCEAWGRTAILIEKYVDKGQELTVSGSLKGDKWEKDGQKHERTKINVNEFLLHWSKSSGSETKAETETDDDLPF